MNFFAILLDLEAIIFVYERSDVGGSSFGALNIADADLDVPTTRQ